MNQKTQGLIFVALALAAALSIANVYIIGGRFGDVKEVETIAKEMMRPADIEVISLVKGDCINCYDITKSVTALKGMNVNIKNEKTVSFDSAEGKDLADKYKILKLPALIVSGEINKTDQLNKFFESNGAVIDDKNAVYTNIMPPYYDVAQDSVLGGVSLIHIEDDSCTDCVSMKQFDNALKQAGVGIVDVQSYNYDSATAQQLIQSSGIKKVPAMMISKDIEAYPKLAEQLKQSGSVLKGNYYIMYTPLPPYRDLGSNKIVGIVSLIMLKDESCKECYDVNVNKQILSRFGLVIKNQETYEIATTSAKAIIDKYKITKIPAILVSPDAKDYPAFVGVWDDVGSVEGDGWYVMRKPELLGAYKDLKTNQVMNLPKESADGQTAAGEQVQEQTES